jgi:hypothetical protein
MNKSERILELDQRGLTTRQIAEEVGCDPAYVRVVRQRQKAGGDTEANIRWRRENWDRYSAYLAKSYSERYQRDPEFRAVRDRRVKEYRARIRDKAKP